MNDEMKKAIFFLLFQFGGILNVTLMTVEIVIVLARRAFGGAAHVTRFDLARTE